MSLCALRVRPLQRGSSLPILFYPTLIFRPLLFILSPLALSCVVWECPGVNLHFWGKVIKDLLNDESHLSLTRKTPKNQA